MATTTAETTERQMVEDDPADKELEQDAGDAFDGAQTGEQEDAQEPKGEGQLFDDTRYEGPLARPKIDGEPVDKIALKFSGTPLLDRVDEADVALMKRMKLGHKFTLMVECEVVGKAHKYTTGRDGELDAVVLQHALKVETVYVPTLEDEG